MSTFDLIEVVPFRPELAVYFESLNREWIEQYFVVEDADIRILSNPYKEIIEPGGQIFFALSDEKVFGTCAVMRLNSRVFELAKMAVSPEVQGRGYGGLLIRNAIDFSKQSGAERLVLLSNRRLKPAIRLYEKYGFKSVPITEPHEYARVDIQMELKLI